MSILNYSSLNSVKRRISNSLQYLIFITCAYSQSLCSPNRTFDDTPTLANASSSLDPDAYAINYAPSCLDPDVYAISNPSSSLAYVNTPIEGVMVSTPQDSNPINRTIGRPLYYTDST